MPNVTYGTPPGGGYAINSEALGGGGAGGAGGVGGGLDWMMALARRKAEQEAEMRDLALKAAKDPIRQFKITSSRPQVDPYDRQMKDLALRERIAEVDAKTKAAPKKLMTGFNINPGWVDDTGNMDYYQRQAFLPQGASMASTPGASPAGLGPEEPPTAPQMPTETIAEMSKRMYGDIYGNAARREDQQYGRDLTLLAGGGSPRVR